MRRCCFIFEENHYDKSRKTCSLRVRLRAWLLCCRTVTGARTRKSVKIIITFRVSIARWLVSVERRRSCAKNSFLRRGRDQRRRKYDRFVNHRPSGTAHRYCLYLGNINTFSFSESVLAMYSYDGPAEYPGMIWWQLCQRKSLNRSRLHSNSPGRGGCSVIIDRRRRRLRKHIMDAQRIFIF